MILVRNFWYREFHCKVILTEFSFLGFYKQFRLRNASNFSSKYLRPRALARSFLKCKQKQKQKKLRILCRFCENFREIRFKILTPSCLRQSKVIEAKLPCWKACCRTWKWNFFVKVSNNEKNWQSVLIMQGLQKLREITIFLISYL